MNIKLLSEIRCLLTLIECVVYGSLLEELQEVMDEDFVIEEEGSGRVDIDEDHLKHTPECGNMHDQPNEAVASSRITNSVESDRNYPWVIEVERRNPHLKDQENRCGGIIITQTASITSSHCICGSRDYPPDHPYFQYVICKAAHYHKIDPKNVRPPNEIVPWNTDNGERNSNIVIIGVGSKDRKQHKLIYILIAYVMHDVHFYPPEDAYDVGLLFTIDERGNGVTFNQFSNVGPLCLAAESQMTENFHHTGKIVTVGWGDRYSDFRLSPDPNGKPMEFTHSCSTNQYGPNKARFQHCNVNSFAKGPMDSWGCDRNSKPNGYEKDECAEYLNLAEEAIRDEMIKLGGPTVLKDLWSLTNKIVVSRSSTTKKRPRFLNHKSYICYKEKAFTDYGWCYVGNWLGYDTFDPRRGYRFDYYGYSGKSWGFCGSSCDAIRDNANSKGEKSDVYHKLIWEFPAKRKACPPEWTRDGRPGRMFQPWYLCFVSLLPQTSVFRFKKTREGNLRLLTVSKEKPEEEPSMTEYRQYQGTCDGDSGHGHWMYDSISKKRALIGITSFGASMWCGFKLQVLKTTYPNILEWIKKHSGIKK